MPNRHWTAAEAVGNALDSQGSELHYRLALQHYEQSVGRFLGASGGGVSSSLSVTHNFVAHPRESGLRHKCG